MTYIISSSLIFFNMIFAVKKRHKKFISFLLLFFMWILYWANTMNPDYVNYTNVYNEIQSGASVFDKSNYEIGYRLIIQAAVLLGINYETYLAILTICSFLLIHSTVKKYCQNYNYIYLLYFIFPFFLDVVQIRNFIIMAIFIYASKYLYDYSIKSKLKYIILILLASTIHLAAMFYLPMVIIGRNRKYLIHSVALLSILSCVFIVINNKQIPYINELAISMSSNEKIYNWLQINTNWGFLQSWFLQTASFLMMLYSRLMLKRKFPESIEHYKANKAVVFVELVYLINLMSFIYFPLYIFASTFARLMRNLLLLNYISFAIVNENIRGRNKLLFNVFVVGYVLVFFLVELYIPYSEGVLDSILQNNLIL